MKTIRKLNSWITENTSLAFATFAAVVVTIMAGVAYALNT